MRVLPLLFLLLMLSAPIPALAADTWQVGTVDVPVVTSYIKATATLYYTNPAIANNVAIKYAPTDIFFYLDRSGDLETSFRVKVGADQDMQASMKGAGFKSGVSTTVVASYDGNLPPTPPTFPVFSDRMNGLYFVSLTDEPDGPLAVFASSLEGSFKEGIDKTTKEPNGIISFKLTYTIAGTLNNEAGTLNDGKGCPGKLVVVLTGKNLAGQ